MPAKNAAGIGAHGRGTRGVVYGCRGPVGSRSTAPRRGGAIHAAIVRANRGGAARSRYGRQRGDAADCGLAVRINDRRRKDRAREKIHFRRIILFTNILGSATVGRNPTYRRPHLSVLHRRICRVQGRTFSIEHGKSSDATRISEGGDKLDSVL